MKRILTLLLFAVSAHLSFSQTLVNQTTVDGGFQHPSQNYSYFKGIPLPGGSFAILYNYLATNGGRENFYLLEIDSTGNPIGATDYNTVHNGRDFGTNLYVKGDYLYVVGFTTDSIVSSSILCNTIKIKIATWDTAWAISESIDSAVQQAPFAVVADDSDNVYVGASVQTPTDFKIAVVKYNAYGHRVWETSFDSVGFYNLPVAMKLYEEQVYVTGYSFDNAGHSSFLTYYVNSHSGSQSSPVYSSGGTGMISHPVNIQLDHNNNSYVSGTSTVSGVNSVIKTVSYDSLFGSQLWMTTWGDSGLSNTASAMATDGFAGNGANIYITGSTVNSSGGHSLVTLRYTIDGTLQWARTLAGADGRDVVSDGIGNVFVTGTQYNGIDTDIVTAAYDSSGNILWMKTYNRGSGINDVPYNIGINDDGSIFVTARSYGLDSQYVLLRYEQYTKTNALATTAKGGQYMNNQLIVRFDKSAVKQDAVNNLDITIAPPSYWLTSSADSALQSKVSFSLSDCKMERIYKGLKTTYKYSIARNGDHVPIPDLWAGFLLIHPTPSEGDEITTAQSINGLYPMVTSTNLNYVGQFQNCRIPTSCRIDDPRFQVQQVNLWKDSLDCPDNYNINIDSAWRLETGKPFVKVGVYDSQLDGHHEDFSPNPISMGNPGNKISGWDFYNNVSLVSENWANAGTHGTATAGFIGAIRNNSVGIAGIAGGSYIDTSDVGITLYGMTIINSADHIDSPPISVSLLCNAIAIGCMSVPDSGYGYGLHVTNNSWLVQTDTSSGNNADQSILLSLYQLQELELAFRVAYRNQTTIVAASGNFTQQVGFPSNFYNDWILCTGGADELGGWYHGGTSYQESHPSPNVDVIAPSFSDPGGPYTALTLTPGNAYTDAFKGTSMAAPHVTGTVALLKSYLDSIVPSYKNLSPEDAQHLITRNADNRGYVGHSDSTGWGLLNAGRSLQDVNKGCKKLLHFGKSDSINSPGSILEKYYTPIKLTKPYTNPNGQTFDTSTYLCWAYKEICLIPHSLPTNFVITDYWTRPSSTDLLLNYDSVHHTLAPYEHLDIDSMTNTHAVVSGYYYLVYRVSDSAYIGLWGMDSSYLHSVDNSRFDYTLLLTDPTVTCNPIDTTHTSIREIKSVMQASFHPNPVQDAGTLQINSDANTHATIEVLDQQGRTLQSVYNGELANGSSSFNIDTKALSSGLYLIVISSGEGRKVIKFLKYD